jgi:hypothetical protein
MLRQMLLEQIDIVGQGGNPRGLVYDPETNRVIDLSAWENEGDMHFSGTQSRVDPSILPREAIFDAQHTDFEVPYGSGRPAPETAH